MANGRRYVAAPLLISLSQSGECELAQVLPAALPAAKVQSADYRMAQGQRRLLAVRVCRPLLRGNAQALPRFRTPGHPRPGGKVCE